MQSKSNRVNQPADTANQHSNERKRPAGAGEIAAGYDARVAQGQSRQEDERHAKILEEGMPDDLGFSVMIQE